MVSDQDKGFITRTLLIILFPPLRVAYLIFDCICLLFQQAGKCAGRILRFSYNLIHKAIYALLKSLEKLGFKSGIKYERIGDRRKEADHHEPLPYENQLLGRFLTHTGALLLGLLLYAFVYFVLVKHHNFISITVAFLLMLAYLLVLENSHSIRSIIMLCLPIMFTNRGRALVFCCMLAIMASGPLKNSQINVNELHKSLNCSKQYLILKADDYAEKNVVNRLMQIEDIISILVNDIKQFAENLKQRVKVIVQLAMTVELYIRLAIEELKKIVDICNSHSAEVITNCKLSAEHAYWDCKRVLGSGLNLVCELVRPTGRGYCDALNVPAKLCEISKRVVKFLDNQIRERLAIVMQAIENMLYVDIDIHHSYKYNGTKSKSFKRVLREIRFDVEQKFWYIHFVVRVFNLVTLILVIWITLTATLYHMHYLSEINYDNMYLDQRLIEIDERRRRRRSNRKEVKVNTKEARKTKALVAGTDSPDDEVSMSAPLSVEESREEAGTKQSEPSYYFIFPMTKRHQRQYLKPFGIWMNEMERHKLLVAGLVWLIINSYIFFFVLLDYGLYHLIELINNILTEILFKSDLPLIDVSSKAGPNQQVVHYNRTYLSQLRRQNSRPPAGNKTSTSGGGGGGLSGMYRKLMDSVERNIPDDVMILDSMQQCLPRPNLPNFGNYQKLVYLALFTLGGVVLEAYALRLRHWIANLFYPKRARRRALWLYRKILKEKPKYVEGPAIELYRNAGPSPDTRLGLEILKRAMKR